MTLNISKLAKRDDIHILRKAWHIVFGSVCVAIYYFMDVEIRFWGYFAIIAAALGFGSDLLRLHYKSFNTMVLKIMGPLMRSSERDSFSGLPFYALGVGLSIILFNEQIAVLSILFLVFADPIASYVGINFGKDKILPNKSLQGTIAAFAICSILTVLFCMSSGVGEVKLIIFSTLAGLVGAMSELASAFNIDDNLTIPVLSGAGLSILNHFFQII